jgi:hypothetical protein
MKCRRRPALYRSVFLCHLTCFSHCLFTQVRRLVAFPSPACRHLANAAAATTTAVAAGSTSTTPPRPGSSSGNRPSYSNLLTKTPSGSSTVGSSSSSDLTGGSSSRRSLTQPFGASAGGYGLGSPVRTGSVNLPSTLTRYGSTWLGSSTQSWDRC